MPWSALFTDFLEWIGNQSGILIWLFFAFSNFLENVFPPWPGDTVTVFGGFLWARDSHPDFGFWGLVTSTWVGNLLGALTMYRLGDKFLSFLSSLPKISFLDDLTNPQNLEKTKLWFSRYGVGVVVVSRFSAGIRFFVSIVAGVTKMKLFTFCLSFSFAIFIWCGLLVYGGYTLGKNWENVLEFLSIYNKIISTILILSFLGFFFFKKLQKKDSGK